MLRKGLVSGLRIGSAILAVTIVISSCTSMITEEQLKKLEQLRQQERELKTDIKNKKSDISDLEKDLNDKMSQLQDCQKKTEFVNEKLAKPDCWPDCWPDWSPNQKSEEEVE